MNKIILSLVAAMFALNTFANDTAKMKKSPEVMANKRADKLKSDLGLSEAQRNQVYSAVLIKINENTEIKEKYKDSANRKEMSKEIHLVNESFNVTMNSILNDEQKVKFEALKAKKKNMKGRQDKGKQKNNRNSDSEDKED